MGNLVRNMQMHMHTRTRLRINKCLIDGFSISKEIQGATTMKKKSNYSLSIMHTQKENLFIFTILYMMVNVIIKLLSDVFIKNCHKIQKYACLLYHNKKITFSDNICRRNCCKRSSLKVIATTYLGKRIIVVVPHLI